MDKSDASSSARFAKKPKKLIATVNHQVSLSFMQFVHMISSSKPDLDNLPKKVMIDAHALTPAAFDPLMRAYLAYKLQHPTHDAVLITGNQLTSQSSMLQTFQHTYTVGLRNQRCKIWHHRC